MKRAYANTNASELGNVIARPLTLARPRTDITHVFTIITILDSYFV